MTQLTLDFGPPPPPDLDNFVPGRNQECLATLRALLGQLAGGQPPQPRVIYIWGPAGSGKSHLAEALAAHRDPALIVVDDCHRLDPGAQEQLFHAFNRLTQTPSQAMVAFGAVPPARLALLPDLVSRLGWGIVFGLEPLADDELDAALQQAARARGLVVGAGLIRHLLRHTRRDMASLNAVLNSLDRLSLEQKRPVDLALLRLLQNEARQPASAPSPVR